MMSVLGKASSGWAVRLSLVGPGWRSSLAWPIATTPPPRPSSLVRTSLEALRSSFSEELVMVAEPHKEKNGLSEVAKNRTGLLTFSYQFKLTKEPKLSIASSNHSN